MSTTEGPNYRVGRKLSSKHMDDGTVTLTLTISSLYPGQTARYWWTWIYYCNRKHYFLSFTVLCSLQTFSHFHCKLQFPLRLQVINSNCREVARGFTFADILEKRNIKKNAAGDCERVLLGCSETSLPICKGHGITPKKIVIFVFNTKQ